MNKYQLIAQSPWFSGMPKPLLDRINHHAKIIEFPSDTYLYRLDERLTRCFCVADGCVRIKLRSVEGQEFALTDLLSGRWFGESALTGEPVKMFEAMALKGTQLIELPASLLQEVAESYPELYKNLFKEQVERTSRLSELLSGTVFHGLEARVAGRLVWLQKHYGVAHGDDILLKKKFTQQDIADFALGSRQRVNKIINNFVDRGVLRIERRQILITDLTLLRQISRRVKAPAES